MDNLVDFRVVDTFRNVDTNVAGKLSPGEVELVKLESSDDSVLSARSEEVMS